MTAEATRYSLDAVYYTAGEERTDMSKGTPPRTIRISDTLWTAAQLRAERDGTTLSEVVRNMLERYAAVGREHR